jgi:hypothetical protein
VPGQRGARQEREVVHLQGLDVPQRVKQRALLQRFSCRGGDLERRLAVAVQIEFESKGLTAWYLWMGSRVETGRFQARCQLKSNLYDILRETI